MRPKGELMAQFLEGHLLKNAEGEVKNFKEFSRWELSKVKRSLKTHFGKKSQREYFNSRVSRWE